MLKGVEYYAEHFSMIELEELEDGPADLEEMIDFITNCEIKKKMIKLAHSVDDFFESFDEDREQNFIMEYIKMHYDNY
jgi:predicted glycosyltransferase